MNLNPRELQIVALLQQGKTNKEIALTLGLSPNTVRTNMSKMLVGFHVPNRVKLVAILSTTTLQPPIGNNPTRQRAADRRARDERRSVKRPLPQG